MTFALRGSLPAMCTPFKDDGSVCEESLRRQIDYVLNEGAHGICVNSLLGEGFKLREIERMKVLEIAVDEVKNRVPIITSPYGESPLMTIELARHAKECGAEALMLTPPTYYKVSPQNIFDFYKMISDNVDIHIMVQDAPPLVGVSIGLELMEKMANEIENVKYLKLELPKPGPEVSIYTERMGDICPIIWGMAAVYYVEAYKRGAIGVIAGVEFPKEMYELCNCLEEGNESKAREIYDKYFQYYAFNIISGGHHSQAVSKKVLYWKNIINSDKVREPRQPLDEILEEELKMLVKPLGVEV